MARQVLRPPDWWYWPKDWINEIKARKGWTDKDIANYLGVSVGTVHVSVKERALEPFWGTDSETSGSAK